MRLIDSLGASSSSGARVTEGTASSVPAVAACVGLLADMIASLPCKLYLKTANGREEQPEHPAHRLITRGQSELHTSYEFRQQVQTGVGFGGNGYARVHRDSFYQPAELEWLAPCNVSPKRVGLRRFYQVEGVRETLTRADIIHVRGLSLDGIAGVSPVRMLRESIGLSLTQREQAGRIFSNGARFDGYFISPQSARKEQLEEFKTEMENRHVGAQNAGRKPVLWGGWDYKSVQGMTMADAEFLESRKFELAEIARWYRIPGILVGDSEKTSSWGTGVEAITNGFLSFSLNPWLTNWEQSLDYTLLTEAERASGYYFKFTRGALLQVAMEAQAKFFREMRDIGVFSINDVRAKLEENDLYDHIGDNYSQPFNGSGGRPAETPTQKEPAKA